MASFKPHADYLLVKPSERAKSNLIQVISHDPDQNTIGAAAEVIAIGNVKLVKVGDIVYYGGKDMGGLQFPKLELNGDNCIIIQEADVVCMLDGDKMRPLFDRLIVKVIDQKTTDFGLVLVTDEKSDEAEVIAIGEGWQDKKGRQHRLNAKVGDRVRFNPNCGQAFEMNNARFLVMKESDLIGILEAEDATC